MHYSTSITVKGQVTIPKEIREELQIKIPAKLTITLDKKTKTLRLTPYPDIIDLAGSFKSKKIKNVLLAREHMENHYERS